MQISKLAISNFRGISEGCIRFANHTVLVGPNNCGKTTVIEALALLFGRERMIRQLTEHDFHDSDPAPADRIQLVATITGFADDEPAHQLDWFRDDRGIVKWFDPSTGNVSPTRDDPSWALACQVAFAARFHRPSLEVETIRYFYDDEALGDVFVEENVTLFPARLVRDMGFFLVPASRTWDRTISFGSELFRKVVAAGDGQPSESVLTERDRLRRPQDPLELDQRLSPIVTRLDDELRGFFRSAPTLHLRVTATDSEGLLDAVIPHYAHNDADLPLPARRHGSGLLSLQHLLLLLQFGRLRAEAGEGFWMALEEPELHVPPALQRRLVRRIQALSSQTFVSTHSPLVAAMADPCGVSILRNEAGLLSSVPLLAAALPANTPNSIRKLFQVNRVETITAIMHDCVLVPEGRTDFEWLALLARSVDLKQGWNEGEECRFDFLVGVIPTHDGAVMATIEKLSVLHPHVIALVDGDGEGIGYATALAGAGAPNSGIIIRWHDGAMLEDVIGWIVEADAAACLASMQLHPAPADIAGLIARLKTDDRAIGGLKKDSSAYEEIADAIGANFICCARARNLLNAMAAVAAGEESPLFAPDPAAPSIRVFQP